MSDTEFKPVAAGRGIGGIHQIYSFFSWHCVGLVCSGVRRLPLHQRLAGRDHGKAAVGAADSVYPRGPCHAHLHRLARGQGDALLCHGHMAQRAIVIHHRQQQCCVTRTLVAQQQVALTLVGRHVQLHAQVRAIHKPVSILERHADILSMRRVRHGGNLQIRRLRINARLCISRHRRMGNLVSRRRQIVDAAHRRRVRLAAQGFTHFRPASEFF
ncbi:MAG: hypothetical protein IJ764_00450 [Bacteroidales bacterium]|nr:hypothetical protein [Bacteroidales bacterium]